MTSEQKIFVEKLELALTKMVHDGTVVSMKWARALGPIIDWLHKDEPVTAVLEAEYIGLDEKTIDALRQIFNVRRF